MTPPVSRDPASPLDASPPTSRRRFVATTAGATAALVLGCRQATASANPEPSRIVVRAAKPTSTAEVGLQPLGFGSTRDGLLYLPTGYTPSEPLPLVVLLHGATQRSQMWFGSYGARADAARVILLAPDSRGGTWDAIRNGFGPDVDFIGKAIAAAFDRCAIDASRMALAGFSDGATYALSLGLANGDNFPHVIAFSPGFVVNAPRHGMPAFFISHGKSDQILPIDQTSRRIVPALESAGYTVSYTEFDGMHEVPPAISTAALAWLGARWGRT